MRTEIFSITTRPPLTLSIGTKRKLTSPFRYGQMVFKGHTSCESDPRCDICAKRKHPNLLH